MLEVQSPIPMHEGESLVLGISTKHVLHFVIGFGLSSPIMLFGVLVFPFLHWPRLAALFVGAGIGVAFVMMPVGSHPLAEWLWLRARYAMRAKVVLFDREYRIRAHRREAGEP